MESLVSTEWLSQHIDDPNLVLLDCTVTTIPHEDGGFHNVSGYPDYMAGHLPNAGFADLKGELCDINSTVEFALPTPEQFCSAMGALGVADDACVVLYDTNYTAWAARVWWMLRWVGFDGAAILDGGLGAWAAEGRPLSTEIVARSVKRLTPNPRPELIADHDEVQASIDVAAVLIDTLPEAFYRGEISIYERPGHIPGAMNIDALSLLDTTGRFRPEYELAALHKDIKLDSRIITYCGGGIAASANAFIMTRLGFNNVAVYTDSLQVWAADPSNPMVVGSE